MLDTCKPAVDHIVRHVFIFVVVVTQRISFARKVAMWNNGLLLLLSK